MLLDDLRRDLVLSTRVLRRSYGFSATAILSIALGVAGSTVLFSIIRGALLQPWPYVGYDRIVTFRASTPDLARRNFPLWSAAEYRDIADRSDVFEYVIAGEGRGVTYGSGSSSERIPAAVMTANTWAMLGVAPLKGRTFDEGDDRPGARPVAVVNHRFWRNQLGGRSDVVGSEIRIDGRPFTIVGVMPPEFVWWDRDVWMPLQLDPRNQDRTERRWYLQARLRSGVTPEQARAALGTDIGRWYRATGLREYEHLRVDLLPLVRETLRDVREALYVLLGAVLIVLAVAATNLAMLLLIRGVQRRGEMAVRLALGAERRRIVRQLLTENIVLASLAALAGLWLAAFTIQPITSLIPVGIPAEAHIALDWRAAAFALAIAVIFGAAGGALPAWRAASGDVALDLKDATRRTASVPRVLDAFLVGQVVLAAVVLCATVTVVGGYRRALASPPGFDDRQVLTFRMALSTQADAGERRRTIESIVSRLGVLPGVESAAVTTSVPVGAGPQAVFSIDRSDHLDATLETVSPGYFSVLRTSLLDGRDFVAGDDERGPRVAIVNRTMATRLWPSAPAVGRSLLWDVPGVEPIALVVVGVVADIKREALDAAPAPAVFVPVKQNPPAALAALVRMTTDDQAMFGAVRAAVAQTAADVPVYAPRLLADLRADNLGSERLASVLFAAFGVMALVLSAIGMYGLTRYVVEQRTPELAVRLALGADPSALVAHVLARTLRSAVVGLVVGAMAATMVQRALASVLVGVRGGVLTPFLVAVVPLAITALVAAYLPARRIAGIRPIDGLKSS